MNIQIPQEYEQTIKEAAKNKGISAEKLILNIAIQTAKMQGELCNRQNIEEEIFSFIRDQQPSIFEDIKSFLFDLCSRTIKIFFDKILLILLFIGLVLVFIAKWSYSNNHIILALILYLALCLGVIIFWGRLFYLNRYILLKATTYTKLKKQWNISVTDKFAKNLAKKYSPLILKLEEENLKMVINSLEQRDKIFSAGTIILAVIIFLAMRYLLEDLYNWFINNTPQWTGDVGIVFIVSTVFATALNLGYFNDLIYYKQALSSLQKAQTYITNKI